MNKKDKLEIQKLFIKTLFEVSLNQVFPNTKYKIDISDSGNVSIIIKK